MKANKKLIQQQLTKETGKIILLKDLTNIRILKDKYGKCTMCIVKLAMLVVAITSKSIYISRVDLLRCYL